MPAKGLLTAHSFLHCFAILCKNDRSVNSRCGRRYAKGECIYGNHKNAFGDGYVCGVDGLVYVEPVYENTAEMKIKEGVDY